MNVQLRIGIALGDIFTDFVLLNLGTGAMCLYKCLATPDDPGIGGLYGLCAKQAAGG